MYHLKKIERKSSIILLFTQVDAIFLLQFFIWLIYFIELDIGFLQQVYLVNESSGVAQIEIGILSGSYQINEDITISATLNLEDGTAVRKSCTYYYAPLQ